MEHKCMCGDARAFEHEVRKIAGRMIHDRRRYLLKDYNGFVLEGSVKFTEHNGALTATVEYADVARLLEHHYKDGQKIRLMVLPTEEFSHLDDSD